MGRWEPRPGPLEKMVNYLEKHYGTKSELAWGIDYWNDVPGRTMEQVVAALRGAARS